MDGREVKKLEEDVLKAKQEKVWSTTTLGCIGM